MAPVPGSPLEHFGVSDPTNAARNYHHKDFIERCLSLVKWSYETTPDRTLYVNREILEQVELFGE